MTDGPARSQNPPLLAGVRVPGIHRAVVSAHKREAIAHDDFRARPGEFAPEFLAPYELQRRLREVRVEAGALKVAMQCGPRRLFNNRARPGEFAPEFLAPYELQRRLREVRVEAGALKVAMQCGPGRLFCSRERPR